MRHLEYTIKIDGGNHIMVQDADHAGISIDTGDAEDVLCGSVGVFEFLSVGVFEFLSG